MSVCGRKFQLDLAARCWNSTGIRASTLANLGKHSPPPHTLVGGHPALPTWVPAHLPPTSNPNPNPKATKDRMLRTGRPFTFYDYMSNFWNPHHQSVVEQHLRAGDLGLEVPPVSVLCTSRPGLSQVLDYESLHLTPTRV